MLVLYIDIKASIVHTKEESRAFLIQQIEVFPLSSEMQYRAVQNVEKMSFCFFFKKKKEWQQNTSKSLTCYSAFQQIFESPL